MLERHRSPGVQKPGPGIRQRYLSTRECAAYIGRTVGAVYHLVAAGVIPHRRLGGRRLAFDRVALDRWVATSSGAPDADLGSRDEEGQR